MNAQFGVQVRQTLLQTRECAVELRFEVTLEQRPEVVARLEAAVDTANEQVSRAEGIRAFRVLRTDFTVSSGELTPTMKVRRSIVIANHAELVERIYER